MAKAKVFAYYWADQRRRFLGLNGVKFPLEDSEVETIQRQGNLYLCFIGKGYGFSKSGELGYWLISSGNLFGEAIPQKTNGVLAATKLNHSALTNRKASRLAAFGLQEDSFATRALLCYGDEPILEEWMYAAIEEEDYFSKDAVSRDSAEWAARYAPMRGRE